MKNFASKARMVSKIFEAHARATLLTWETVQDLSINTFWQNYDYTITLIQRRKNHLHFENQMFLICKKQKQKKEQTNKQTKNLNPLHPRMLYCSKTKMWKVYHEDNDDWQPTFKDSIWILPTCNIAFFKWIFSVKVLFTKIRARRTSSGEDFRPVFGKW